MQIVFVLLKVSWKVHYGDSYFRDHQHSFISVFLTGLTRIRSRTKLQAKVQRQAVNKHITQYTSPVSVVSQCKLTEGFRSKHIGWIHVARERFSSNHTDVLVTSE